MAKNAKNQVKDVLAENGRLNTAEIAAKTEEDSFEQVNQALSELVEDGVLEVEYLSGQVYPWYKLSE